MARSQRQRLRPRGQPGQALSGEGRLVVSGHAQIPQKNQGKPYKVFIPSLYRHRWSVTKGRITRKLGQSTK